MSPRARTCLTFSLGCAAAVVLALIAGVIALRATFKSHRQASMSMEPAIARGDKVIVRRPGEIERGDVVIYRSPVDRKLLLHRVIGLPGDVVELRNSGAIVNGFALDEPYIKREPDIPAVREFGPVTVPAGSYFMLGDNRDNANDSRFIGFVKRADITGKAVMAISKTRGVVQLP